MAEQVNSNINIDVKTKGAEAAVGVLDKLTDAHEGVVGVKHDPLEASAARRTGLQGQAEGVSDAQGWQSQSQRDERIANLEQRGLRSGDARRFWFSICLFLGLLSAKEPSTVRSRFSVGQRRYIAVP